MRLILLSLFSNHKTQNRYLAGRACYEVKDADDPLKQIEVPGDSVIRLREGGQGFAKGDDVSIGLGWVGSVEALEEAVGTPGLSFEPWCSRHRISIA